MAYLLIALGALAIGPVLLVRLRRWPAVATGLDGFVAAAITGLIFLQFVPGAVERREFWVLAALVVGFLLPIFVERTTRDIRGRADRWGLLFGLTGLALHAALDGAALATVDHSGSGTSLAFAVILHRLPVGIAVWWLTSRAVGRSGGIAALLALMAATAVGFYFGSAATRLLGGHGIVELYQAIVGGSLVHVVLHRGHALPQTKRPRVEGWGALTAVALLLVIVFLPGEAHPAAPFLSRLLVLSAESAPALLVAYLFAGLLASFLPSTSIRWMGGGGAVTQAGKGMLVGLPLPICSCGVVPIYQSLVARGAPPAAAMAFLVATPELGLDAILLSIPLLGVEVTLVRLVAAVGAALLAGWWVGGRLQAQTPSDTESARRGSDEGLVTRLRGALSVGTREVVDHTAPWILLGLGVAALVAPWLDGGGLDRLPSPAGVLLFAALGFPTYVCASSATPLVATLLAAGLSPGAGIAFLITGPATNLSTLGILSGLHGRRTAVAFAGVLVTFAVTAGLAIDTILPGLPVPTLAQLTEEAPSRLQLLSLAGLALLFAASILRRGMDGFIGEIGEGLGMGHSHSHSHSHEDAHEHSRAHDHLTG
jgi:uncharacterized membrane protein YraQ (UPF0718 family)